jgi:hypothetical protein
MENKTTNETTAINETFESVHVILVFWASCASLLKQKNFTSILEKAQHFLYLSPTMQQLGETE